MGVGEQSEQGGEAPLIYIYIYIYGPGFEEKE